MNYQDIRPTIKSGDILAWSHTKLRSWYDLKIWMVRLFTQSEYTHVGTAWVIGDRVFVIEAVMPLVRIYPLSKLGDFYHLPLGVAWTKETEALALSYVGHKYSQAQAIRAPFGKPPKDSLWQCAELTATIAASDWINLGELYTPSAIVLAAQQLGATTTYVINPNK
jgi:hypothetical protein